jgi:hypothetical protein
MADAPLRTSARAAFLRVARSVSAMNIEGLFDAKDREGEWQMLHGASERGTRETCLTLRLYLNLAGNSGARQFRVFQHNRRKQK